MLSVGCRRFLRSLRPGVVSLHRQRCSSCDRYVSLLELTAEHRGTLPESVRDRLQAIPDEGVAIPPLAKVPMPDRLRHSLRSILPARRPVLSRFVGSPVYSVAASYLIVVAITLAWGNPYELCQPTIHSAQTSTAAVIDRSGTLFSIWLGRARAQVAKNEQRARLMSQNLKQKWTELENAL